MTNTALHLSSFAHWGMVGSSKLWAFLDLRFECRALSETVRGNCRKRSAVEHTSATSCSRPASYSSLVTSSESARHCCSLPSAACILHQVDIVRRTSPGMGRFWLASELLPLILDALLITKVSISDEPEASHLCMHLVCGLIMRLRFGTFGRALVSDYS